MAKNILTHKLQEPLNGETTAKVEINAGYANLAIGSLSGGEEELLAGGALQYFENQNPPVRTLQSSGGRATLTLKGADPGRPRFGLPWKACTAAYEWQINLNPTVATDITAHSDGGNVHINLEGCAVSNLMADTGGGNMEVVLPEKAASLSVTARSGAGNVAVRVPGGVAAKVHGTSGLGKVIVDNRFDKLDGNTYQSPDYETAANRVDITVSSGAGNVSVSSR